MSLLRVRNLSFSIEGRSVFEDVEFELSEGECLCVVGPSGSGKTSLLRCLSWLERPTTGSIALSDRSPSAWGAARYRSEVCYVPQHPPLLGESARAFETRIRALSLQRGRAFEAALPRAQSWGLDEAAWERPFDELSGGERQRVLLALALSCKPRLLLLDEPTSALDAAARERVEADLANVACVWVTHDAEQAARVGTKTLELSP